MAENVCTSIHQSRLSVQSCLKAQITAAVEESRTSALTRRFPDEITNSNMILSQHSFVILIVYCKIIKENREIKLIRQITNNFIRAIKAR